MLFCSAYIWLFLICIAKYFNDNPSSYLSIRDNCMVPKSLYNITVNLNKSKLCQQLLKTEKLINKKILFYLPLILIIIFLSKTIKEAVWTIICNFSLLILIAKLNIEHNQRCTINALILHSTPHLVMLVIFCTSILMTMHMMLQSIYQNNLSTILFLIFNLLAIVMTGIIACHRFIDYYYIFEKKSQKAVYVIMLSLHLLMGFFAFGFTNIIYDKEHIQETTLQLQRDNFIMYGGRIIGYAILPMFTEYDHLKKIATSDISNTNEIINTYISKRGIYLLEIVFIIFVICIYKFIILDI